jgi:hypothetical protein
MNETWQMYVTFALLAFAIAPGRKAARPAQLALLVGFCALAFLPISSLSLAAWLRTYIEDLAITSVLLLGWVGLVRLRLVRPMSQVRRWQIFTTFSALALFLYPATLGLTYFDPYRLGYAAGPLLAALALITLCLWLLGNTFGVALLVLATLAFAFSIKPSGNYWDYLLDPFLALYCWGALLSGLKQHWTTKGACTNLAIKTAP